MRLEAHSGNNHFDGAIGARLRGQDLGAEGFSIDGTQVPVNAIDCNARPEISRANLHTGSLDRVGATIIVELHIDLPGYRAGDQRHCVDQEDRQNAEARRNELREHRGLWAVHGIRGAGKHVLNNRVKRHGANGGNILHLRRKYQVAKSSD